MSTVKWLHSGMTGAPSMTGLAGSLVALLDACLVTGFGLGTLDSVVVAGGVATATRAAGHPFEVGTIVNVSGATPAGLNGDKRVLSSTVVAYTFDATGIADQVATGTIVHKAAPLGWEKPFASTNLGVYRSPNVESTRNYLRVNDTINPSYYAQVIGYEEMTAHSAGTKPFPTSAMAASGGCWVKSVTSDSAPRPWVIVGDDRGFYFCSAWGSAGHTTHYFGDINSLKSPDPYRCLLVASPTSWHSSVAGTISQLDVASAYTGGRSVGGHCQIGVGLRQFSVDNAPGAFRSRWPIGRGVLRWLRHQPAHLSEPSGQRHVLVRDWGW